MRYVFVFLFLLAVKLVSKVFFRFTVQWVGREPERAWDGMRVLAILNHTSLYEPIFAGAAPNGLLWQMARHGVLPVAQKTVERPLVGRVFRVVANQVVSVTRERDQTWNDVLERISDPDALVVILPEGRMKRTTGLDLHGRPMTIRGGIADILLGTEDGRMLLVYSGGLHHIHAPGDRFPRLFKKVRLRLELLDIREYRGSLLNGRSPEEFKAQVIDDLTHRRDTLCP
jgi:1-acyl-sn-glycerol-3-phosphate acyltransferase